MASIEPIPVAASSRTVSTSPCGRISQKIDTGDGAYITPDMWVMTNNSPAGTVYRTSNGQTPTSSGTVKGLHVLIGVPGRHGRVPVRVRRRPAD
jgi:hypothetical protein